MPLIDCYICNGPTCLHCDVRLAYFYKLSNYLTTSPTFTCPFYMPKLGSCKQDKINIMKIIFLSYDFRFEINIFVMCALWYNVKVHIYKKKLAVIVTPHSTVREELYENEFLSVSEISLFIETLVIMCYMTQILQHACKEGFVL